MPSKQPILRQTAFWLLLLSFPIAFSSAGTISIVQKIRKGKDVALFFAVNEYENYKNLSNPIKNAENIAAELKTRYGFETMVYKNPTKKKIESVLKEYQEKYRRNELDADGQLLIFFSGHGTDDAFIAANTIDGDEHNSGFQYFHWRKELDKFSCKHILVAIDACYSATFDPQWYSRTSPTFAPPGENGKRARILQQHKKYKTRFFFTSDAKADQTPDNSEFAFQFLTALRRGGGADGLLTSTDVYSDLVNAIPRGYGGKFGGHEASGSFLFIENVNQNDYKGDIRDEKDVTAWKKAKNRHTIAAYNEYLKNYPDGIFAGRAYGKREEIRDDIAWEKAKEQRAPEPYLDKYADGRHRAEAKAMMPPSFSRASVVNSLVLVKGGSFVMGCRGKDCENDEKPAHNVSLKDFYISKYEVTNAAYCLFLNEKGNQKEGGDYWLDFKDSACKIKRLEGKYIPKKGYDNHPVILVTWYGAQAYSKWVGARLPKETEWEYAAKGGHSIVNNMFSGSNVAGEVAWYYGNSAEQTHPIGEKTPNQLGLYDMSGNVWEWCESWYYKYAENENKHYKGANDFSSKVCRGGSWGDGAEGVKVTNRGSFKLIEKDAYTGFRIAKDAS